MVVCKGTMVVEDSSEGSALQLDMIKEFAGEDDVSKADMLVLRGLGLADVSVRLH